jgi:serine/threonine protein kinase
MEVQKSEELFLSPYFISPEMAEHGQEDKSGDLFSFGALFYYMLTGKFPFDGRNDIETVYSRIIKTKSKKDEIFLESSRSNFVTPDSVEYSEPVRPIEIRPEIPESISHMIMRLLSYHPKSRSTAPQILDVINHYQAQEDKEHGITAAQKKMVLTKTITVPQNKKKKKGLSGLFGLK